MKRVRDENIKQVVYLLDASASMAPIAEETIKAINEAVKSLSLPDDHKILIYSFNEICTCLRDTHINDFTEITTNEYRCFGMTSLYDSLCEIICNTPRNSTLVVATDGTDTSSKKYTEEDCNHFIKDAQTMKKIEIFYIAQGDDAIEQGSRLDIDESNMILSQNNLSQTLTSDMCKTMINKSIGF
jgi:uncharacterized protein with von Willebrand factor type A (vWA) domain